MYNLIVTNSSGSWEKYYSRRAQALKMYNAVAVTESKVTLRRSGVIIRANYAVRGLENE